MSDGAEQRDVDLPWIPSEDESAAFPRMERRVAVRERERGRRYARRRRTLVMLVVVACVVIVVLATLLVLRSGGADGLESGSGVFAICAMLDRGVL